MTTFVDIILKIGGLAGLISILWLIAKDLVAFFRKPRLSILPFDLSKDLRVFHYKDVGWIRKFANICIENSKIRVATHCVATLTFIRVPSNVSHLERQYYLHWADVDYSARTIEAQPIDLGRGQRRLDVVFTQDDQQMPGCWLAMPLALCQSQPDQNQAYLPPGKYEVQIVISSDNGRGDKRSYSITSPTQWSGLNMSEMTG